MKRDQRKLLLICLTLCATTTADNVDDETDGQSSRKILGSSVVTSVSVVMETGNGKHTYFSDAVGHPLSKPHIASQVASPINLLNPDRYEFYTFNDNGELVKRLMTLQEIQGIIAGGDGEASNYNSEYHAQIDHPENDVSGVVENVQNVLKEEMEAHKNPLLERPIMDTPDVSSTWNLILPAFFGGDTVTIQDPDEHYNYVSRISPLDESTERMNVSSKMPEDTDENDLTNLIQISTIHDSITSRTTEKSPSTSSYTSPIITENTRPVITENTRPIITETTRPIITENTRPIIITTEKMISDEPSITNINDITTESQVQTKVTEVDKDIYNFDVYNIEASTQNYLEEIADINSTTENNKLNNFPDITERVNLPDKDDFLSQTITELVSMITRPTTKASEKTTTTSVTFPPTTQFTHSEQISQTSATPKPVSINEKNTETPPLTSSDIIKDNFVILSLNNDKNNNVEQDNNNNTVQEVTNGAQLDATKYDVISNVEQIIENITKTVLTDNDKVPVENYNVTEEIQEILKSPDYNVSVTLASSMVDTNKVEESSTTENVPLTSLISTTNKIITTEKQESLSKEGSTPLQSTTLTQVTEEVTPVPLTTMQKIQILTTTPIPYLNPKRTTPEISTIETKSATIISSTAPETQSTTTSTTTERITTSKLPITTEPAIISSSIKSSTTSSPTESSTASSTESSTASSTTKASTTASSTTETSTASSTTESTTAPSTTESSTASSSTQTTTIPTTTSTTTSPVVSESTTPEFIIINRFKIPSTTTENPATISSTQEAINKLITKLTTLKLISTTPQRTTTEKITTPMIVTTIKQKPTSTPKPTTIFKEISVATTPSTTTTTTEKPTTNAVTFITKQIENNTQSTTEFIEESLKTTIVTTKRPIVPSSTETKTVPISSTTKLIPSTTSTPTTFTLLNISEPYRKTEDFISPNKLAAGDTWKLVDTVRPPDYISNKTVVTTSKPILEPYQPPVQVDLSTQGNFGMPGLSEDMLMFSRMYNELALKFWSKLAIKDVNSERSVVVSPFGTISMLAMIFLGARGGTSGEMNDVLKLDDIMTFNPHLVFKEITEDVIARKSPSAIVRELYSDSNRGKVHEFYRERVRQFYDGHIEEVDFKKIQNVIRRRTNSLISKQTRGQLPQYLEETMLFLRSPLSALSTNIFQADCSQASTEGRDGELYFIVLPSIRQRRLVPIPAAVWRGGFIAGYDPELDATAVSLGTMSQAVSTVFVMPGQQGHSAPGDVLLRLEARLLNTTYMPEMWTQLFKSMLPRPGLEIQLPRFLHKSVINTTDSVKRMGLTEMFNKNKADLRGINGIGHDLYFSDMMQVNEFSICGDSQQIHTEIYPSMTEHLENHNEQMRNFKYVDYFEENEYDKYSSIPLPLRPRQARLPEIPRLRFDRPFLYFVRHNPTGLILHMGRFNPRLIT